MSNGNRGNNQQQRPSGPPQQTEAQKQRNEQIAASTIAYPDEAKEAGIEKHEWYALTNQYPGARLQSLIMVHGYCKARNLDPLKKPVHIVPMNVKDANTQAYFYRDVIMPGIAEARITASRTGLYVGIDEPKFGKSIDIPITNKADVKDPVMMNLPESVTITVYKLVGGKRMPFSHVEWMGEAIGRKNDGMVNEMWYKRSRGMLAKCAEAGALRKAFPEELGGQYFAEEFEGKHDAVAPEDMDTTGVVGGGASGIPGPEEVEAPEAVAAEPAAADAAQEPAAATEPPVEDDIPEPIPEDMTPEEVAAAEEAIFNPKSIMLLDDGTAMNADTGEAVVTGKELMDKVRRWFGVGPQGRDDGACGNAGFMEELKREFAQASVYAATLKVAVEIKVAAKHGKTVDAKAAAANPPTDSPATAQPAAADSVQGDWKIDLPGGARSVLTSQLKNKKLDDAWLLNKMQADVTTANVNKALTLIKEHKA